MTLKEWQAEGIKPLHGNFSDTRLPASLLLPDGTKGRAFLVFHNFRVLMRWNHSTFEGLSVRKPIRCDSAVKSNALQG